MPSIKENFNVWVDESDLGGAGEASAERRPRLRVGLPVGVSVTSW